MNVKKTTKEVKEKLKEFGHEVKHTHCREIVAIANGLKNSHHLPKKQEKPKLSPLYLTLGVVPNTSNEYYCEAIKGVKIFLNSKEVNEIINYMNIAKENDVLLQKSLGKAKVFESIKDNFFGEVSDEEFELKEEGLYLGEDFYNDKKIYQADNVYEADHEITISLNIVKEGLEVEISLVNKYEQVFYSSSLMKWDDLFKEKYKVKKEEKLMILNEMNPDEVVKKFNEMVKDLDYPKTIVYLRVEEDPVEKRENNRGYSVALMYLGEFTKEMKDNGELLEVYAEHLWENDSWVDSLMNEIMDRSQYFSNSKEAVQDAIELAKSQGYYVVNLGEFND